MENLLFSLQSVLPLFVLILIGYLLKRRGIIDDKFISAGTKIVFQVSLPVSLFHQVASADLTSSFNPKLIFFSVGVMLIIIVLLCLIVPVFIKDNGARGAFIQGVFRGNYAILGIPLAISMFGEEGAVPATLLMPFAIPIYNIAAVVVLTLFGPQEEGKKQVRLGKVLKGIVTNPLIIGIVLAIPFSLLHVEFPSLVDKTLDSIADLTTPLALICLGGQFTFQDAKEKRSLTIWAVVLKEILIPAVVFFLAVRAGFRGYDMGAIFIMYMAPSAVSSYIMAKNMHSDDTLAAQILVFTTLVSCFTMCVGIYVLRTLGYM